MNKNEMQPELKFSEYCKAAAMTDHYPNECKPWVYALGLTGESGELADKIKKVYRDDGGVKVGKPLVDGAKVTGKVLQQGKEKKILVFKYKAKSNYRRRQGHRQPYTKVSIEKIEA